MTANNCDRCGNDKGPDCWEDKCKPAERRPTYAELEREVELLRESETKAWWLLSRVVFATGFGNPQEEDAAMESARAALEARKAGL